MINGLLTLQTQAFVPRVHRCFMLQVALCRALRHYLCERDGQAHTEDKHKTTESANFISHVRPLKRTIWSCQHGAGRRGKHGTGKQTGTIKTLTELRGTTITEKAQAQN